MINGGGSELSGWRLRNRETWDLANLTLTLAMIKKSGLTRGLYRVFHVVMEDVLLNVSSTGLWTITGSCLWSEFIQYVINNAFDEITMEMKFYLKLLSVLIPS